MIHTGLLQFRWIVDIAGIEKVVRAVQIVTHMYNALSARNFAVLYRSPKNLRDGLASRSKKHESLSSRASRIIIGILVVYKPVTVAS